MLSIVLIYTTSMSIISLTILYQMTTKGGYSTNLLMMSVTIAYGFVILIIGYLAKKFIVWLRFNRNMIVFFYLVSALLIIANSIISPIFVNFILINKSEFINYDSPVIFDIGFSPGSLMDLISKMQTITFNGYYIALWLGTIFLLRFYINKIGKLKFYIVISMPIIYFLSYGLSIYQAVYPSSPVTAAISSDFMIPILLYTFSFVACGILFGIAFYLLSKSVTNSKVKIYLNCTGIGIVLFIISASATVLQAALPPYGIPNTLFVGFSSFLILFGLYNSATIIANDSSLYKKIKSSISNDSKLLESIGKSEYESILNIKLADIKQKHMNEIKIPLSLSASEDELRDYAIEILEELQYDRAK
jgi:hypothetical protein